MKKTVSTMLALGLLLPGAARAQSPSSILPVLTFTTIDGSTGAKLA